MSNTNTDYIKRTAAGSDLILATGQDGEVYASGDSDALVESVVIPVVEEQIEIGARLVETGRVRITKTVHTHEETVDEPILQDQVNVERVSINRPIDEMPAVRFESGGEVMVVPVVEEALVVTKQLVLKEELRITRTQTEQRSPQTVTLRSEAIDVERVPN